MQKKRRKILKVTPWILGGGLIGFLPVSMVRKTRQGLSPNDRIHFGVIGCNGMGWSNMRSLLEIPEVGCVALCDVDQNVLERRKKDVIDLQGTAPRLYVDYRKMLEDTSIDAVVIGTPDHWHCKMFVDALSAGKHVYVEKPIANSIEECEIMVKAAEKYQSVVQVGQWQRSGPHYKDAINFVRSGQLGPVRLVKTWSYQGWLRSIPKVPDSISPEGVDYGMWLGPAPNRRFNKNRFHFTFRWFWDYAGGLMTDWGVHEIDIALFAMGATSPVSVLASGGKFAYPDDAAETPDTMQAVYQYDRFNMLWEHAIGIDGGNYDRSEGIAFIGNNGTLVVNRQGWEVIPEKDNVTKSDKIEGVPLQKVPKGVSYLKLHCENFVDAIKANNPKMVNCGIETGSVAAVNAHMGNVAYKLGRKVFWDPRNQTFRNDSEANVLKNAHYHNGWEVPEIRL